ncbi:MAG: hypothetical protein S4CHLAM7_07980 [Chlamydiae bacterium]|nr:hypothetical protein [Chlamydiota bacterium]
MNLAPYIPELKHMLRNFTLFLILSPIIVYGLVDAIEWLKKSWRSGSKLKKWYSLTFVI